MRTAPVGSESDHRAENGTTKCPESLCPILALPLSGRRVPPPARTLLPGHGSYGLIRQSRSALPYFGLSLVRGVSAGCYQPLLPAGPSRRYLCESFLGCLGPCHGGSAECICLFLPPRHRPSPVHYRGRLPACARQNDFMTDPFFETAAISLCQAPKFACLPDRSYRCDLPPQGSRGFYVRAEHASLPPHASDILTTRPGNWWCGDLHPTRFTALSAAPV
jgi:hypothetical protein